MQNLTLRQSAYSVIAGWLLLLTGCGGSSGSSGPFTLIPSVSEITVVEGETPGAAVLFNVEREEGSEQPLRVSVAPTDAGTGLMGEFSEEVIFSDTTEVTLNLTLPVAVRPIQPYSTQVVITVSDGVEDHTYPLSVNIQPTNAPDVYLLIGQSNMVGFSGDGTKQAGAGQLDEPHDRIFQLNVTPNNEGQYFYNAAQYSNVDAIALQPRIVRAEDPLHIPQDPDTGSKEENYVGLGLSFARRALQDSTANVVLVPAAWSGTSFCLGGGFSGNWNADQPDHASLGNTRLFDRAVARTNLALSESGGILRGILWHQGESDADPNYPECADLYQDNLTKMVAALRSRIQADRRGEQARLADGNIPFVLGTMSRGSNEFGSYAVLNSLAQKVDDVHRSIKSFVPYSDISIHDDLTPANGYPCGNTSCIHFGAEALREMGNRYYDALVRAASG